MPNIFVGSELENNQGSRYVITSINGRMKVSIRYLDDVGYEATLPAKSLKDGSIKNPYHPVIFGVGFMGVGKYRSAINGKRTPEYEAWKGMLSRAYDPKLHKRNSAYCDCTVCPHWHNFQNFAEWLNGQRNWGKKGYELDKDVLGDGNKVYSPENCELLPRRINLLRMKTKPRGDLPPGVSVSPNGKFRASCRDGEKNVKLGTHETKELAFEAYKNFKEKVIKEAAEEYRSCISERAYRTLMNTVVSYD